MNIAEKLLKIADNVQKNVEFGKSQGGGGDLTQNPLYYARMLNSAWGDVTFPEEFEFVLEGNTIASVNGVLMRTKGIKKATFIHASGGKIDMNQFIRESSVQVLDLTQFALKPSKMNYFALSSTALVSILGELDMSECTTASFAFSGANALQDIRFKEGTISIALDFKSCTKLSSESYDSIMQGLSTTATGQTLTLPAYATVKATYDAKYGEGSWDILAASKTNWTIAYS